MNTFVDKESLGSIRAKLNLTTLLAEQNEVKTFDYVATADQDSGSVTSQTTNTISDGSKSWVTNQFVGSVVKVMTATGEEDFAIVSSNTATQLTFDDLLLVATFTTYRIMSTFTVEEINSIISFDVRTNCCALVLPSVSLIEERKFVEAYIELSNNGDHKVAIVCKGTDRQRGKKWATLIHKYESVTLWTHYLGIHHWDILNLENVKRFANVVTTANIPITTTTYAVALPIESTSLPFAKRYEIVDRSSLAWLKYSSIITTQLSIAGSLSIQRTGGGTSLVELTIRKKRFSDGVVVDSTVATIANFTGDETKTIPISLTIDIEPNDEITLIARRNSGTINLLSGSSLLITEM